MGGAAAAEAVIQNPENIAALVLVAPAIVAWWMGIPDAAKSDYVTAGAAYMEEIVGCVDPPGYLEEQSEENSCGRSSSEQDHDHVPSDTKRKTKNQGKREPDKSRLRPLRVLTALVHAVITEILYLTVLVGTPLLILALRWFVRNKTFWERGLAAAWSNKSRVIPQYVDGYRFPQLVRGWELGMVRFLRARLSEKAHLGHALAAALQAHGHLTQAERLAATCQRHSIPVLLVHGVDDVLVPVQNSRRLAKALPGARLIEFQQCGHMPHEECASQFTEQVATFVESLHKSYYLER